MEARSIHRGRPERGWSYPILFQSINRAWSIVAPTLLRSEFSHVRSSGNAPPPQTLSPPLVHRELLKIAGVMADVPVSPCTGIAHGNRRWEFRPVGGL